MDNMTERNKEKKARTKKFRWGGMCFVPCVCSCCVGIRHCDGPITRPGDFYRERERERVSLCLFKCKNNPLHLQWDNQKKIDLKNSKAELLLLSR
jgi:hypothetical protein